MQNSRNNKNVFSTSTQPKPSTNIFDHNKSTTNIFGRSGSPGVNIWSQNNQQTSQDKTSLIPQSKSPPVNIFANGNKLIQKPNLEDLLQNKPSINLSPVPIAPKVQSPPRKIPNIFAPDPSQKPPANIFQQPSNHWSRQPSNVTFAPFQSNKAQFSQNQQQNNSNKSKKVQSQNQKPVQPQSQNIKIPNDSWKTIDPIIDEDSKRLLCISSQGSSFMVKTRNQHINIPSKLQSDPTNNEILPHSGEEIVRPRQTSFEQILQHNIQQNHSPILYSASIQVAHIGKSNKPQSQKISAQKQGSQLFSVSPYKPDGIRQVEKSIPVQPQEQQKAKQKKQEKPKQLNQQYLKEQKQQEKPSTKNQHNSPLKKDESQSLPKQAQSESQQKKQTYPQVKPDLRNKHNQLLSTIRQRSFEQSAIGNKQQQQEIQEVKVDHLQGPSYMDYTSSARHSYMQNVSSSNKQSQREPNEFKITSSKNFSSPDDQNNSIENQATEPKVQGLTKSESLKKKNEVNVPIMTESQKISQKKSEQGKKEPSSQKKPKQSQIKEQKPQTIKKQSIFGRNRIQLNLDKQFKDIVIPKQTVKMKQAESEQEYDQNEEQADKERTTKKEIVNVQKQTQNPSIGGHSSSIENLRENARKVRKSPRQSEPKTELRNSASDNSNETKPFHPVNQVDNRQKYKKQQEKSQMKRKEDEVKPEMKEVVQRKENSQGQDTQQMVLPSCQRRITFGSDGKEFFSKQGVKAKTENKPVNKESSNESKGQKKDYRNLSNSPQNLFKVLNQPQPSLPNIIQETNSAQQSPERQESPSKVYRVGQHLENRQNKQLQPQQLIQFRLKDSQTQSLTIKSAGKSSISFGNKQLKVQLRVTPEKGISRESPTSSEKKKQKTQLQKIRILLDNLSLDLKEMNIIYGRDARNMATNSQKMKQSLFQLDRNNAVLSESSYANFIALYQLSTNLLQCQNYMNLSDQYNEQNNIPEASIRQEINENQLQMTEKLCQQIQIKQKLIQQIFNKYEVQLIQEKKQQQEQCAKKLIDEQKKSFFSIFNLVRNKYCWSQEKSQSENIKPKLKSTKQYSSFINLKESIASIISEKKANLTKIQENVLNCLQQPNRIQLNLFRNSRQHSNERTTSNLANNMSKFKQVLLERQKRSAEAEKVKTKSDACYSLFWEKVFNRPYQKVRALNLKNYDQQMFNKFMWNLQKGPEYFRTYGQKQKWAEPQEQKTKTPFKQYNEICQIQQKYMKVQQNYRKYQQKSSTCPNELKFLRPLQIPKEQVQEQRINEKIRLNQQIFIKANSVSVRLKSINFRVIPFISSTFNQIQQE